MRTIQMRGVTKDYPYFEKREGLRGAVGNLFCRVKRFRRALDHLNLDVEAGEFVGLMGPNGAGKTTAMKLATGIIQPTSGDLRVNGYDPRRGETAFKKSFAVVMGQKSQLWWDLPAVDSLRLNQAIYDIDEAAYRRNVQTYTRLFEVEPYLGVQVRKLSLGERMKFEIIAALLHEPRLLFLDEPTLGLDAVAQRQIRAMLRQAGRERGVTLLLTSHYTEDLLDLTPRCVVMRQGRKIYDGNLKALLEGYNQAATLRVTFSSATELPRWPGVEVLEASSYAATLKTDRAQVQALLRRVLDLPDVSDIRIADDDVTELVERMYRQC